MIWYDMMLWISRKKSKLFFILNIMNKFSQKVFTCISCSIIWLSIAATAYASSYTTTYSFSVWVNWWTRYFNGTNIQFKSPKATSTPFIHPSNKTYNVALYRDKIIDDYIGSKVLYRDNSWTANWSNVWSWNYYVYLSKENDGVTLVDNKVTIKNY